jgi:uncharacterized protein YndB with AHSA1/START domain
MATLTTTTTINQPVEKVFNYVVDVSNHKAWQASIAEAEVTPAGPVGVGSTYVYTTEVMGQRIKSQMQVSAFEPNRTWAVRTVGVPNSVETVYAFAPVGEATQLTISMEVPAGAYPAAAEGMIKQQMQKSLEEQGARIRQAVGG